MYFRLAANFRRIERGHLLLLWASNLCWKSNRDVD